jgi:hypothetical protein
MPSDMPLDALPIWVFIVSVVLASVIAEECGYRLGHLRGRRAGTESDSRVGGMVGAELGLLAFLLAFTFGMAASRFDSRREVLLSESNAIGTTYLRAAMLPEPHRGLVRSQLREYVDVRLAAVQGGRSLSEGIRRSEEIHGLLWAEAIGVSELDPRSVPTGLFIQSLNEVIDLHSKRLTVAFRSRIPTAVWTVLFAVAVMTFLGVGYQGGVSKTGRSLAVYGVVLTFAVVLWLVVDLDRPGEGLLKVSQQPMIELRKSME